MAAGDQRTDQSRISVKASPTLARIASRRDGAHFLGHETRRPRQMMTARFGRDRIADGHVAGGAAKSVSEQQDERPRVSGGGHLGQRVERILEEVVTPCGQCRTVGGGSIAGPRRAARRLCEAPAPPRSRSGTRGGRAETDRAPRAPPSIARTAATTRARSATSRHAVRDSPCASGNRRGPEGTRYRTTGFPHPADRGQQDHHWGGCTGESGARRSRGSVPRR